MQLAGSSSGLMRPQEGEPHTGMSSMDGEPLSQEGRPGRDRGGGRSDAAGPKKGVGPPVLLMGSATFWGQGQLTGVSSLPEPPGPSLCPLPSLRPTSEEALMGGGESPGEAAGPQV